MPATFSGRFASAKSLLPPLPESQIRFALSAGLTRLAKLVRESEVREMVNVFDRPTRFTLNSVQVVPAQARDEHPVAYVWFKDKGGSFIAPGTDTASVLPFRRHYVLPQVFGGNRPVKTFEHLMRRSGAMRGNQWVVPGWGAPLDAHGNIPGGQFVKILAWVNAFHGVGGGKNTTAERKAKLAAGGTEYFTLTERHGGLGPGFYLRKGKGGAARVVQILAYIDRPPNYKQIFRFYDVAEKTAQSRAKETLREAGIEALLTRKR